MHRHCLLIILFNAIAIPLFAADTKPIRVALYADKGVTPNSTTLENGLKQYPHFKVRKVTAEDIALGKLSEFDIVIHPGGSGGGQGKALGDKGRQMVRDFVKNGGGYLGICAGAYLATCDYDWSLHILDARVIDRQHWARGFGNVEVNLTPEARKILGVNTPRETIYYHQGPLLAPAANPAIDDYQALGTFETEIAKNGAPVGVMKGTTAIATGTFGKGKVFCFSPHPERTEGLMDHILHAITWAAQK